MGMTRDQAIQGLIKRHQVTLSMASKFRCSCCEGIYDRKDASHVGAYRTTNSMMEKIVPGYNIATYVVCQECARLPEKTMLLKIEQFLVKNGLLRTDLKPLDSPGGHSPGHNQKHQHGPNCSHGKGSSQSLFPGRG